MKERKKRKKKRKKRSEIWSCCATKNIFQANILFKSFEIESDVDRVLVYVTLYIIECLKRMQKQPNLERATLDMHAAAREQFALPGDANFPLNAFFSKEVLRRVDKN